MASAKMRIVLGTMAMGGAANHAQSLEMIETVRSLTGDDTVEIDTARKYQDGVTEQVLGDVLHAQWGRVVLATKCNPWYGSATGHEPHGGLSAANVRAQLAESLAALKTERVDIVYLHAPDHATPIEETLAEVNRLHREGKFGELGLSNYAAWQVAEIVAICKANGYVMPTLYQGMYNCVTRAVEAELLPCLRRYGMRFYAYNPLAGGLLTGKFRPDDDPTEGRFSGSTYWGQAYRKRFWNESVFGALDMLSAECAKHGISTGDAALRWMRHHSQLGPNDAIIIGASQVAHVASNVQACLDGPLPASVVDATANAWQVCRAVCPLYHR